jgi:hypothetical protein
MEPTLSSETSAFILRTPGKFPKEYRLHSEHGESLKTTSSDETVRASEEHLRNLYCVLAPRNRLYVNFNDRCVSNFCAL